MKLIGEFLGDLEMNGDGRTRRGMGGWWRKYVIRNLPDEIIERACGEGRFMVLTQKPFKKGRGPWLNSYIADLAGLESLQGLPPGPPPRA